MTSGRSEHENTTGVEDGYNVTLQWAARALGLSANAVNGWAVTPVSTVGGKVYNMCELVTYRIQKLEEKIKHKNSQLATYALMSGDAKDAYYRAKTEEQHIKTAKMKAELLDRTEVEKLVLGAIAQFRAAVLAVPSRISDQCGAAETRQEAYDILKKEMETTLTNLTAFDISQCHGDITHLDEIEADTVTEEVEKPLNEKKKAGRPKKEIQETYAWREKGE